MPYDFSQDGFRQFSEDLIKTEGDQALMTTILADMQDTYNDNIGKLEKAMQDADALTKERDRLKESNMELFLRIGSVQTDKPSEHIEDPKPMSTADYMQSFFDKQK